MVDEARQMCVILMKLTNQGAQDIDAALDAVDRVRASMIEPLDIREASLLVTMGGFDLITVLEAADASAAAAYALALARTGFVTTESVLGFTTDQVRTTVPHFKVTRGDDFRPV